MQLKDRSAVITGASMGLGKVIAQHYLKAGANVCILARNATQLEQTANELKSLCSRSEQLLALPADVSDEFQMKHAIEQALHTFGNIEILVNNAGIHGPKGCLEDIDLAEWKQAMDVNVLGIVIASRLLLKHFKANQYGKIINLSGGGATKPMPRMTAYAASKAAVVRLSETIAKETEDFHIDVNSVAPGALNTRLLDDVLQAGPEKVGNTMYEQLLKQQASGGGDLDLAAELVVYLGSSASDGVTGRLISAVWDDWKTLKERVSEFKDTDIYTLRRILAKERGFDQWSDR